MWKDLFGLSFHRLQSWIGWQPIAGEMLWLGIAEPLAQWMPRLHKVKRGDHTYIRHEEPHKFGMRLVYKGTFISPVSHKHLLPKISLTGRS